ASTALAAYKRPKEYVFVPALPKTPNGKIKRGDLKEKYNDVKSASRGHGRRLGGT
ncbi:MAG: hypothetical protein HY765_09485, partial [Rhodomicrobium sp.]|nr:hypothetical protein [Rhodomicrobium sp.]